MRLLLVNQFYPPDAAPTGRFLQDLAGELAGRGHTVHVRASRTAYAPGAAPSVGEAGPAQAGVRRLGPGGDAGGRGYARRALLAGGFLRRVAYERDSQPMDVVIALTSPPFLGWAAARTARRRGARLVHWVMDVYPDALVSHGLLPARGPLTACLRGLARRAHARAALVVALGPFMAARLRALVPAGVPIESVPLWGHEVDPETVDVRALRQTLGYGDGELVLMYSGNLGRGHRVDEFLEAARRLGARGPRWVFAGGGARRAQVEAFARAHPEARVELQPYLAAGAHVERLLAADVHLASLGAAWQGVIVPSKVQAAFALGRPVLFVGPSDNEPADWVRRSGGGWTCAAGDVEGLLTTLAEAGDEARRSHRAAAAKSFAARHFDRAHNLGRLADLVEKACTASPTLAP
jgi:glycosyltransferase involved in cell wall biosynthesis